MAQTWPLYVTNNLKLIGIFLFGWHDSTVKIWAISVIQKQRYCRNSPNMALLWPKHGPYMVPIIWYLMVLFYLACTTLQWKFEVLQASRSKDNVKIVKTWPYYGPNMAQTWLLYGWNNMTLNGILLFVLHDSPVKIWGISGI